MWKALLTIVLGEGHIVGILANHIADFISVMFPVLRPWAAASARWTGASSRSASAASGSSAGSGSVCERVHVNINSPKIPAFCENLAFHLWNSNLNPYANIMSARHQPKF